MLQEYYGEGEDCNADARSDITKSQALHIIFFTSYHGTALFSSTFSSGAIWNLFEPVDTCGQAHVGQRPSDNMSSILPPLSASLSSITNMSSTPSPVSTIISVMSAPSSHYSGAG